MNKLTAFLLRFPKWTFTVVVTAAILWLTLAPDPLPDDLDLPLFEGFDKVVHAVMMAGLVMAVALDVTLHKSRRHSLGKHLRLGWLLLVAVGATALGGAIELAQGHMDMGRGADWLDFAADGAGAFVAAIICRLIPSPRSLRRPAADQTGRGPQSHPRD